MEYTQWEWKVCCKSFCCLNPCCNGIYSMSCSYSYVSCWSCLNPCCNGIYSMSVMQIANNFSERVLILVVMEYTQWVYELLWRYSESTCVLILVVMEYTQWETEQILVLRKSWVLILVVMEYTQWVSIIHF